jgi:3-deoxy-D-manno-octulosonic-acid transferase
VAEALRAGGGVAVVSTGQELEKTIRNLISMPGQAGEIGQRAYSVYRANQGAVDRICEAIALRWGAQLSGSAK